MNSEFVIHNARETGRRLVARAGTATNPEGGVRETYGRLLPRSPSAEENEIALDHLKSQQRLYARANAPADEAFEKSARESRSYASELERVSLGGLAIHRDSNKPAVAQCLGNNQSRKRRAPKPSGHHCPHDLCLVHVR